ncbi:hypothetical protein FE392_05210 [Xenorhabdus sp. 12]|uniref:Uncharacterized protein n=1 Tax=Xenorhabdus santafensis TaxID=2582833 RepID=A0ABU4S7L8_9GAMM|nr:hypothetical protein [Xenorhabdus sp. 12]MDX7986735.1 hypothetical protein [Xenorhabdus sp. 12]
MLGRRLYNESKYRVDIYSQGSVGTKIYKTSLPPESTSWAVFDGNELLSIMVNVTIHIDVKYSVVFSQDLYAKSGGYLYDIFNKSEGQLNLCFDPNFYEFTIYIRNPNMPEKCASKEGGQLL